MTQTLPGDLQYDPASGVALADLDPEDKVKPGYAVDLSLSTGDYIQPSAEQFEQHDVQLATTALVPAHNDIRELILKKPDGTLRSKAEIKQAALQLTRYKRYPSALIDAYLNQPITVIGVFEYLLPPFEKEDPRTHEKFIERTARSQKLHVIDKKGQHIMLRFGADSIGEWVAIMALANGSFDWAPEDHMHIIITSGVVNGKKTYFVEVVE